MKPLPTPPMAPAALPDNIITEGLEDLGEDYLSTMAASIPLTGLL